MYEAVRFIGRDFDLLITSGDMVCCGLRRGAEFFAIPIAPDSYRDGTGATRFNKLK
jgi:hypothetical protein